MQPLQPYLYLKQCLLILGILMSFKDSYGQAQCATNTLNVVLNNPTVTGCGTPRLVSLNTNGSTGAGTNENLAVYYWYINGVLLDSVTGRSARNISFGSVGSQTVRVVGRLPSTGCYDTANVTFNIPAAIAGIVDPPRINTPSLNPIWTSCNTNPSNPNNNFTVNVRTQGTDTLKNYTIIWGDATPNATGASSAPGNFISHTYTALGEYNVTIINNNGSCIDTIRGVVRNLRPVTTTILPLPAGQLAGCAPHTITFQDSTENAFPGTIITWNFGVGQPTIVRNHTQANTPISYTYPREASQQCVFSVSITATNTNCPSPGPPSTLTISPILIYDEDIADAAVATPLCNLSRTVTLLNNSQLNCEPGQRLWFWDFGDGTNTGWITSQASQVHTFPTFGTYLVMLIDSNFCGSDTDYLVIRVNRPPSAGFIANPKQGCAPLQVTYADTTLGLNLTARTWNFGTGSGIANRSDSTNTVTYNNPGTFVLQLTATNECGTAVARDTIRVFAKPTVRIRSGPNGCAPFTRTFLDSTINQSPSATYKWTFGNIDSSTLQNPPAVTFNSPGTYPVKLVVTDTCGSDSFTVNVIVSATPVADFIADTVCRGDTTTFINTSNLFGDAIGNIKWYFGDGDSSTIVAARHRYATQGTKTVVLRIQTDKGCVDFDTLNTVFVNTSPNVSIASPNRLCDGNVMNFNGTATAGAGSITGYQWTFGNGITDTARSEDTSYLYPAPGTYTVRYRVSNSNGCAFTEVKNITIDPIPDARPTASNLCFQQFTQFRDSSTVTNGNNITQWEWDFDNDLVADSLTQHSTYQFPSSATFKVRLRVGTNNNCFNTDSIDVVIRPLPVAAFVADALSKCKLDTFVLNNGSTGASSYTWRFGDGTPDSVTTSISDIRKSYADSGSFTIRLIATTAFGCLDTAATVVQSRPFPVAAYTVNDTISCAPKTFTFTNTSLLANNYVWQVNGIQTTTNTNRPDTLIATSGQQFTVGLIATNIFGCRPDTLVRTLRTIANPIPDFSSTIDSGCGPLFVSFSNNSSGATGFQWQLGNGTNVNTINAFTTYTASLLTDSLYQVKLIAFNGPGCADSISKTIKVFPQPVSNFTVNRTDGCGPLPVQFTNQSQHLFGGGIADMLFDWQFGNGVLSNARDTVVAFQASSIQDTLYSIRLIAASRFGCKDTSQAVIRVYPNPTAAFTVNQPAGCGPLPVQFTNNSVPNDTGSIGIMTFNWNFRNGNTSTQLNPQQVFSSNATKDTFYQVQLIAFSEHGCRDTGTTSILVFPKPLADFTMSQDSGCTPFNAVFTNTSTPYDTGDISIMSFIWDLGNGFGNVTQNAFGQYISKPLADSSYTVTLFAASEHGCRDTVSKRVVSHPLPIAGFTNNRSQGCGPLPVQFTNSAQLAATYNWNFGDGVLSNAANPLHTFQSYPLFDTIYTISFSVLSAFGCKSDTVIGNIIARYQPIADFVAGADSICSSGAISFTNQSIGGVTNNWSFGNGLTSTAINPVSTYAGLPNRDTTYSIRLIVSTPYSCRDTTFKSIKVNPLPDPQFTAVAAGCTPLNATLINTSLRSVRHEWDFGDGTTDTSVSPVKVFANNTQLANANFTITLRTYTASGCNDTAKQVVIVYPQPIASFLPAQIEGCGPLNTAMNNQSAADFFGSPGMQFDWNFGNGIQSTLRNPSPVWQPNALKDTTYTVSLVVTSQYGCKDTATTTARVFPRPTARFSVSQAAGCSPLTAQFTNQSNPNDTGSIDIMSFIWDFGNGINAVTKDAASQFTNLNLTDSAFNVRLVALSEHGCRDTARQVIISRAKPVAAFTQNSTSGCGPFNVQFIDQSRISSVYRWNFGDGTVAAIPNPQHTFLSYLDNDTIYPVTLVTESAFGCVSDTARRSIIGRYLPQANFFTSADSTCNPGTISFFNTSFGGATNQWSFGNGGSSAAVNPIQTFSGPLTRDTTYRVRLAVTSPSGCRDTAYRNIKVNPIPDAGFVAVPPACSPLSTIFNNTSQRATRYEWDFGDGNTSTAAAPLATFFNDVALVNRNYNVTLKAFNNSGCMDTAKHVVTVHPLPIVNYTANKTLRCDTAEFSTINSSQGASSFRWLQRTQVLSTESAPPLYFRTSMNNDSLYQLKLIGTTVNGCRDSITKPILVRPLVDAAFTSTGSSSCSNLNVAFNNQSRNGVSYFWLFGDGTGSPVSNPSHQYTSTGSYDVLLIAYDAFGCTDTASRPNSVNVFEVPSANFLYSPPDAALPNSTITFRNLSFLSSGSMNYEWTFGDNNSSGNTSTLFEPSHTYSDSGNYVARLIAISPQGCRDTFEQDLRIRPHPPVPDFEFNPPLGCSPLTVQFLNRSQFADAFEWTFDDGQKSSDPNPVITFRFPGKYGAFLRASGPGGIAQLRRDEIIEVFSKPRANFFATPLQLILPNSTVSLTDISTDASKWIWRISKGRSLFFEDTLQNTTYTFGDEGQFDVSLIVITDKGCSDTLDRSQLVNVLKGGKKYIANAFTPNGDGNNDVFKPYLEGVISEGYKLEIFNRWGQRVFVTNNVNEGWNGMYEGEPATIDAYVWVVQGNYVGFINFSESGTVTLIR